MKPAEPPGVPGRLPADSLLQTQVNDAISRFPGRLQGFATLATPAPKAAVDELRRSVAELGLNGALVNAHSDDHSLDSSEFWGTYEAAADRRAPLYLHPRAPFPTVNQTYCRGFSDPVEGLLAAGGLGWHYDAGLTLLRMILAGRFDRFPDLQIIMGHQGGDVLFYLDRVAVLDRVAGLQRPIADYFCCNVFITPGGISSHRYLRWATEVVGIERIMRASDYPFNRERAGSARRFLQSAPIRQADRAHRLRHRGRPHGGDPPLTTWPLKSERRKVMSDLTGWPGPRQPALGPAAFTQS